MDLLVVGGSGFLGHEVTQQARAEGDRVVATFHNHAPSTAGVDWRSLDIRQRDEVARLIEEVQPDAIINVAYRQGDWAATADGGMHVAVAAATVGARLVYVSSDAVFSGAAPGYDETCKPDPTTPYGAAKAAAETAIKGLIPAAIIARTSLIIGDGNSPREKFVHALATGASTGVLFTDAIRCPVHVTDLAAALLELARSCHSGVHHIAGSDAISHYELGVLIARRDGLDETLLPKGQRADTLLAGPSDVRLECVMTQLRLATRIRGVHTFLASA